MEKRKIADELLNIALEAERLACEIYNVQSRIEYVGNAVRDGIEPDVVHGRWTLDGGGMQTCSVCGEKMHMDYVMFAGNRIWKFDKYCSHCGARMDANG